MAELPSPSSSNGNTMKPSGRRQRAMVKVAWTVVLLTCLKLLFLQHSAPFSLPSSSSQSSSSQATWKAVPGATQDQSPQRSPLSRHDQAGSWIGNTWIPPAPQELYSAQALQTLYANHSVAWVGDSTAWGDAGTLLAVLHNETRHQQLDRRFVVFPNGRIGNRQPCDHFGYTMTRNRQFYCKKMPPITASTTVNVTTHDFSVVRANTLLDMETFIDGELAGESNFTATAHLLVVGVGIWHVIRPNDCMDYALNRTTTQVVQDVLTKLHALLVQTNTTGIWRTSGFGDDPATGPPMLRLNDVIVDWIDAHAVNDDNSNAASSTGRLAYVDWGRAVLSRSFGDDRIAGDVIPHYGEQARMIAVQMITNQWMNVV